MNRPRIVRAANDLLFAADGQRYIDLFSAHGVTWLGHRHPGIVAEVAAQLDRVWLTGGLGSEVLEQARTQMNGVAFARQCHEGNDVEVLRKISA